MAREPLRLLAEVDIIKFFKFCSLQTNYLVLQLAHQISSQFMKLHLPKVLMCALVAFSSNLFAETVTLSNDNSTITKSGDIEVKDNEYIGMFEGTALKDDYFTSGVFTQSLMLRTNNGGWTQTYTYHDLTINGTGRVVVAGKYDGNSFAGITADKITVAGNDGVDNLIASTLLVNSLEVSAGNVALHTDLNSQGQFTGGNSNMGYMPVSGWDGVVGALADAYAKKMVTIKDELKVTGGSVTIGVINGQGITTKENGSLQYHYLSGFGKAINQEGGLLTVHDMSLASGNLAITQTGGVMSLSATSNADSRKVLAFDGAGTCTINQSGDDSVMTLGRLTTHSGNGNKVTITQNGGGIISLTQGADFKSNGTSSITQKGSGAIYLSGSFVNTAYNISQTGENITNLEEQGQGNIYIGSQLVTIDGKESLVSSSTSVTAGKVEQTVGILSVSDKATFNATGVTIGGTLTNDGTLTTSGTMKASGTVDNNKNMVVQSLEITGGTTTNAKDATLTAGSITVNGGTFVNYGAISSANGAMMLAVGDDVEAIADTTANLITIASGVMKQYGVTTENILVKDGGALTLNADASVGAVTLEQGGKIDIAGNASTGALTLEGGTITFELGASLTSTSVAGLNKVEITVNLSDAALNDIKNGNGFDYELFTNSTGASLAGTTVNFVSESGNTASATVKQDSAGKVTVGQLVPEPTTATLSLLALAALAARRRRR